MACLRHHRDRRRARRSVVRDRRVPEVVERPRRLLDASPPSGRLVNASRTCRPGTSSRAPGDRTRVRPSPWKLERRRCCQSASASVGGIAIDRRPSSLFESRTRSTFPTRSTSRPPERLQLRPTEAGQDEREEHDARLLVGERLRDPGDLDGLEDLRPERRQLRTLGTFGRVQRPGQVSTREHLLRPAGCSAPSHVECPKSAGNRPQSVDPAAPAIGAPEVQDPSDDTGFSQERPPVALWLDSSGVTRRAPFAGMMPSFPLRELRALPRAGESSTLQYMEYSGRAGSRGTGSDELGRISFSPRSDTMSSKR